MDHLIPAGKADLVLTTTTNNNNKKKENLRIVDFAVITDQRGKIRKKRKKRQVVGPCQRSNKAVEHKGDSDTSCDWST